MREETREELKVGVDYLHSVTALLQRVRGAHPTFGSYEAGEVLFWWGLPRSTDGLTQLFWFDGDDRPVAAVTVTDFGDGSSMLYEAPTLAVIVMPDAEPDWVGHVVERGLAHVGSHGIRAVEIEVGQNDHTMHHLLLGLGFTVKGPGFIESWLNAKDRPEVSPLPEGYRLAGRNETMHLPHHLIRPGQPDVEQRLQQTPLYRSDLDLVALDADDANASYGLFWFDPVTKTGIIEPMRTSNDHQRRGLARHVLTAGLDRLAEAGAERVKIVFDPDNPGASNLYLSVGFEPLRQTNVFSRS